MAFVTELTVEAEVLDDGSETGALFVTEAAGCEEEVAAGAVTKGVEVAVEDEGDAPVSEPTDEETALVASVVREEVRGEADARCEAKTASVSVAIAKTAKKPSPSASFMEKVVQKPVPSRSESAITCACDRSTSDNADFPSATWGRIRSAGSGALLAPPASAVVYPVLSRGHSSVAVR